MKNYIIILLCCLTLPIKLLAQNPSTASNFVIETTVRVPGKTTEAQLIGLAVGQVNKTINYVDGLGRPLQTVNWQGSPDGKDVVKVHHFDAEGRESKVYQPYKSNHNDLRYNPSAITDAVNYYQNLPAGQFYNNSYPFSETVFERSPLNRIAEKGAPGASWQPINGRTAKSEYLNNTDQNGNYKVRHYKAVPTTNLNHERQITDLGWYAANVLTLTILKDENWTAGNNNTIEEYKDNNDKLVAVRKWLNGASLTTYYVYDDFENLIYVISPKAEGDNGSISNNTLDELCYQYYYDDKMRIIEKKFPGKGWESIVYNNLDQVVFTQDKKLKNVNAWIFMKYDALGRVILSGKYTGNITRQNLQNAVNAHGTMWEKRDNSNSNGSGTGYTLDAYPTTGITHYLTINYYDDYSFYGGSTYATTSPNVSYSVRSLPTGNRTFLADGSNSYLGINWYNEDGKLIENIVENHIGGADRSVNSYSFADELTQTVRNHTSSYDNASISLNYGYDNFGKQKFIKENIDNNSPIIIASLDYNDIGQLIAKNLGNVADYNSLSSFNPTNFIEHTNFLYNERGWLKRKASANFDMLLNYQENSSGQFNGNISSQEWGILNNRNKNFTYYYDELNRLTYGQSNQGFGETINGYDKNGNVLSLSRNGRESGTQNYAYTGNQLNALSSMRTATYTYDENGNMLTDSWRGINNINYNFLNLPSNITTSSIAVNYTFLATGQKLRKQSSVGGLTDYVAGIHYGNVNGTYRIEFIQTAEGRAVKGLTNYHYEFTIGDHLGNNRVTIYRNPAAGNAIQILESTDYYPFGWTSTAAAKTNKYLYNGKENQEEFDFLDYGARFYDPITTRWSVIDKLAADPNQIDKSPYIYAWDNPTNVEDPDGNCPNCVTAIIGGVISGGIELGSQLLSGKSLRDVDWADVAIETGKGVLIGSGIGVAALPTVNASATALKASTDWSKKDGLQTVFNGTKSKSAALFDATADVLIGKATGAVGKKIVNFFEKGVEKAVKAEVKAVKGVVQANNNFNKVTDGGKNMFGVKPMMATAKLDAAKATSATARKAVVRSQVATGVAKGPTGEVAKKTVEASITYKIKKFFDF